VGGLLVDWPVSVTIQNMGINDVSGVTLVVKWLDRSGRELDRYTKQLDTLFSGEEQKIGGFVSATLSQGGNPEWSNSTYVATLTQGDKVLDERKLT
jgi:hypothetical protein